MSDSDQDTYLWLEDVASSESLDWARKRNLESEQSLVEDPSFSPLKDRLLSALDSDKRLAIGTLYGSHVYHFWRDQNNPKGLWRRTFFADYQSNDPKWEIVIDLDALAAKEDENWVWKGANLCYPKYQRALLRLSRGGADAIVVREFDLVSKQFVAEGFYLPEAKSRVSWIDENQVYVGTDFGPGSLTDSGYPRMIKRWKRGETLSTAKWVFIGKKTDVSVGASVIHHGGQHHELVVRSDTFWTQQVFRLERDQWVPIDKPPGAEVGFFRDQLLLQLRKDWVLPHKTFSAGSLLTIALKDFLQKERTFSVLFEPTPTSSLHDFTTTKDWILLNILDNVQHRLLATQPGKDGRWEEKAIDLPVRGTVSIRAVQPQSDNQYWLSSTDFLTPISLSLSDLSRGPIKVIDQEPKFFDRPDLVIEQHMALSSDGTHVPYFQIASRDMPHDGQTPTLLYGYGGFEISMRSSYRPITGISWLEKGGVYVVANIRGGGEFGPRWHQSALKEHRQRAYDDFIAVAEDLIRRKVTSPNHLGIRGGSNGGLLMGNMLVQRPDLFGAIICQVPLLDMRRYHKLLAGASWMGEYGNPDLPDEWKYLAGYSPYHRVRADQSYPPILITTSTRDDRVHPGHARKMVAKMRDQGHQVLYYENMEGGHGGAADNQQRAHVEAMIHTFLWKHLGVGTSSQRKDNE